MKSIIFSTTALWLCVSSFADTIHVPSEAPTIQIAISKAAPFDTIIVAPGEYFEAISFGGKVITVQSSNPNDPAVVANTIINAGGLGSVVTFSGGEDQVNTKLHGFTITGGVNGIRGNGSRARIRGCIIRNNTSTGIENADGIIEQCEIRHNGAFGISVSDGLIESCTIAFNSSDGIYDCDAVLNNSSVHRNSGRGVYGGYLKIRQSQITRNGLDGIYGLLGNIEQTLVSGNEGNGLAEFPLITPPGFVKNSIVAGNRLGGASNVNVPLLSCTLTGNRWTGIRNSSGPFSHLILWDNSEGPIANSATPIYSGTSNPYFVEPGFWDAVNNVWIDGNYHLTENSPYIDAGDPGYFANPIAPSEDADGNPRLAGLRVDIGAFEYHAECDGDDLDDDEIADVCDRDIDGDGIPNVPDVCDDTLSEVPVGSNGRPLADLDNDCSVNLKDFAEFQKSMSAP